MRTIHKFEGGDIDNIIGLPLVGLDDEFPLFGFKAIGKTVSTRVFVISKMEKPHDVPCCAEDRVKYSIDLFGEPIEMREETLLSAEDLIKALNDGPLDYRICTNEELEYIFKYKFRMNEQIKSFVKLNYS